MCIAIPSKIIHIHDNLATVDVVGARRKVSLLIMPEEVDVGDYVLVHAGFAIQKVEKTSAQESLGLFRKAILTEEDEYI